MISTLSPKLRPLFTVTISALLFTILKILFWLTLPTKAECGTTRVETSSLPLPNWAVAYIPALSFLSLLATNISTGNLRALLDLGAIKTIFPSTNSEDVLGLILTTSPTFSRPT